jgi:hypothetical protein
MAQNRFNRVFRQPETRPEGALVKRAHVTAPPCS